MRDIIQAPMYYINMQVEIYTSQRGLSIVGYYHANELLKDSSVSDTVQAIASKIAQHCDKSCLLMVRF